MKRKRWLGIGVLVGLLVLLVALIGPAAPLLAQLGVQPVCIQGEWPDLYIVTCSNYQEAVPAQALPTLSGSSPRPVIFDDDGSPDGVIALLYFLRNPLFEVKAVTVSYGEAHPDVFAPQLQRMLAGLGRGDIPVGAGRATPLEGSNAFPDPWRQASDNFWGLSYPQGPVTLEVRPAAELMVETINQADQPVMVFVSGTHTNLAEALALDPSIAGKIHSVHIMGGSIYVPGNIHSAWPENDNQAAEWNIWVDPAAAALIFHSGLPLYLTPLDATNQVTWTRADARAWAAGSLPEGGLASDYLEWMLATYSSKGAYIWDLTTAVNATDPALCPQVALAVDVLTAPGPEQGRTMVTGQPPNITVCLVPDAQKVKGLAAAVLGH